MKSLVMKIHGFPQITPLIWLRFCTWQTGCERIKSFWYSI